MGFVAARTITVKLGGGTYETRVRGQAVPEADGYSAKTQASLVRAGWLALEDGDPLPDDRPETARRAAKSAEGL